MSCWREARRTLVVGHRGGRGEGWPPENTIGAFERARSFGAAAVELDVRASVDGVAVVFHDRELTRMTSGRDRRPIASLTSGALRAVDLGGTRIPTLAEVLVWARESGVAVNVEMKHDVPSRLAVARSTFRAVRSSGADVLFSSFDPLLLGFAGVAMPHVPRAFLTHTRQAAAAVAFTEMLRPPVVQAIHVERIDGDAALIARYAARSLRVGVWTVNDPAEAASLARLGAAWIITDAPEAVIASIRT